MSYSKFSQDLRKTSPQSHHLSGKSSTSTSMGSREKVGIACRDLVDPTKCTLNRIDKPQVEREATRQPLGNYVTSTTAGPRILQYGGFRRGDRAAFIPLFVSMSWGCDFLVTESLNSFGCSQFTEETQASTYARRLYSFCETPIGVALTFWSAVMLGFKWHQEPSKVYRKCGHIPLLLDLT